MKGLFVLAVVSALVASAFAVSPSATPSTPSPFPTVYPSPSQFWGFHYWSTSYEHVVSGGSVGAISNQGPPYAYYTLNDLPTGALRAKSETGSNDGWYMGYISGGISLQATDQYAISGTAIGLNSPSAYLLLPAVGPTTTNGAFSWDFWYLPETGATVTFDVLGCANGLGFVLGENSVEVVRGGSGTSVVLSAAPNYVYAGHYSYVVLTVSSPAAGVRVAKLYIDAVLQQTVTLPDASANFFGCSQVQIGGASAYLDEMALYGVELNSTSIDIRFVVGEERACRCRPCFSASNCFAAGSESFTCAACPTGYTGDGQTCVPTGPGGNCTLPSNQSNNPLYCVDNCDNVNHCMECAMNFVGLQQTIARLACNHTNPPTPPGCSPDPCPAGFTCVTLTAGYRCDDINECVLHTDNCSPDQVCANTFGSFYCYTPSTNYCDPNPCPSGYTCQDLPTTYQCNDINECLLPSPPTCPDGFQCTNLIGSWNCTDINECLDGNNGGCMDTCINLVGTYDCACRLTGYNQTLDYFGCYFTLYDTVIPLIRQTRVVQGDPSHDYSYTGLSVGYKNKTSPAAACTTTTCAQYSMLMFDLAYLAPDNAQYNFSFVFLETKFRYQILPDSHGNVFVSYMEAHSIDQAWAYKANSSVPGNVLTWNNKPPVGALVKQWPFFSGNFSVVILANEFNQFNQDRCNWLPNNGFYLKSEANSSYSLGTTGLTDLGSVFAQGGGVNPAMIASFTIYSIRLPAFW